ncbi:methyl-accepting chemotaxis protein [Duganella sp. SG902]|uniref:methyl-accepting chemotaxis protein n=1 Tax=Duganella sp. SG902 TaxID=2587016 RepID=UPI00159DEF1B|nr:methyl-accepting chemotaxis protein [Duganella sp. SG902]NVM79216.1 methyl-accepting chemotaxis protein [Duganella sp. SG902]
MRQQLLIYSKNNMSFLFNIANLKVGTRLALGFGILMSLMLGLTATGVYRVNRINTSLATIGDANSVKQRYAINFRGSVHDRAIALRDVVLESDPGATQRQLALITTLAANYARSATPMDALLRAGKMDQLEADALRDIAAVEIRALKATDEVVRQKLAGDLASAQRVLLHEARPAYVDWLNNINVLIDLEEAKNKAESADARAVAQAFAQLMIGLSALAIGLAAVIGWIITRSVVGPIRQATAAARTMATGDLTLSIDASSSDEGGRMLLALRELRDSLEVTLRQVRRQALSVAGIGAEIEADNQFLDMRTSQQATALEETHAVMQQLSAHVQHNALRAQQAQQFADEAKAVAAQGGTAVAEVVATMRAIDESARKIGDIIAVIDSIAFQTNILALNAAVEAARAGEAGRGFAVVAAEVRNLASRCASAAMEIKLLISASEQNVETGGVLVNRAGTTMSAVVGSISKVADMMGGIRQASDEQAKDVSSAGQAVAMMDGATRENAALVTQTAKASGQMRLNAQQLLDAVDAFALAPDETPGERPPNTGHGAGRKVLLENSAKSR